LCLKEDTSLTDYCAPIYTIICQTRHNKLRIIQTKCLRIIYNLPFNTSTDVLISTANIPSVKTRHDKLSNIYFDSVFENKNELP
jgi:hypothetical protein